MWTLLFNNLSIVEYTEFKNVSRQYCARWYTYSFFLNLQKSFNKLSVINAHDRDSKVSPAVSADRVARLGVGNRGILAKATEISLL